MAVQFILGRAGTGKTQWCFDRIVQTIRDQPLGPAIYWIVPRQATFLVQRQLACASGLGGYFRARILDFQDLAAEILAECGGTARPQITDRGRRMILGHLLRQLQPELQFFASVAHQPGMAAELDGTFAELHRGGQDAAEIKRRLTQSSAALRAKVHDLALIDARYAQFLGQDRLDPDRRIAEGLAAVEQCRGLRDCDLYVDSFYDFTGSERALVVALAKVCRSVSLTLTIHSRSPCIANPHHIPAETSLCHRGEQAYRRLYFMLQEKGLEMREPIVLGEVRRFRDPQLASLEFTFFPADAAKAKPIKSGAIYLIEAPDRRAEVDAAARWIGLLTRSGMRYRDIAVLMRSQEEYHPLIEASFREHNIPFFVDRRRTAAHHPLLRLIRAALGLAATNWSHESIMAIIKTGLAGLSDIEADELENYALLHGIHHGTWTSEAAWTGRRRGGEESDLSPSPDADQIDALRRRLVDRLAPFMRAVNAPRSSVKAVASALVRLLEDFQCRQQIIQWMDRATLRQNLEERGEHERIWEELVKLFDELVDLFGDEPISLKDFSAIVDSALENFDLALAPPTLDQVLVGGVDRTRTPAVKACAVIGLSEGQFPRSSMEGSIFTDSDRQMLRGSAIDLDPDSSRKLLDENFLGYLALTRASERLLLTRATSDDEGRPVAESSLWRRVVEGVPSAAITHMPREEELPPQFIATPRQLVCGLMRWARRESDHAAWAPVYQWLANRPTNRDATDAIRYHAWKALSYKNDTSLDPARASALFASPLKATMRQIESFRMCPYQHFARYGLQLAPRRQWQVTGADLSHVYHEVLEHLVRDLIVSKRNWQSLEGQEIARRISELTAQLGRELRRELMLSSARNRYLLGHVEKTLALVALAQKAAAEHGDSRPAFANVRFGGGDDGLPPLSIGTPSGKQVLISGKMDRVDLLPDGSACVIDYRLIADRLDPASVFHGLSLQLLSFLLVLEQNGRHLTSQGKLTPAAAFCVQLLRQIRTENPAQARSPDDPLFHLLEKPRGIFNLRIAAKLDKSLTTGQSHVLNLHIKQDGTLGRANNSDAASADEFAALLRHVERRVGQIADEIMAGRIDIRPYRLNKTTPCPSCEFRALCRLEPSPGCYDDLEPMSRPEMFERIRTEK